MAIYFVKTSAIVATPADTNDGRDPIGFGLTAATYDDTGNGEGEHHLSSTGAFSGYTHQSDDLIYLSGGAGITPGLYEIASKVDDDAILLSESAGSDSSGDVTSSDGPFATVQTGVDTATVDDELRVCNDGTHTTTAQIDCDLNSGARDASILYAGYDARGASAEQATIQADTGLSGSLISATQDNLFFRQLILDGNDIATHAFERTGGDDSILSHCRMTGATSHGVDGCFAYQIVRCEVDNNGGRGLFLNANCTVFYCSIHDNAGVGAYLDSTRCVVGDNLIYDNGDHGVRLQNEHNAIIGNVVFGNTGSGIFKAGSGTSALVIVNNSLRSNGGYGIDLVDTTLAEAKSSAVLRNNHFDSNTSGETNPSGDPTLDKQTGDPLFASETDGAEDFTPQDGSPLLNNGLDAPGVS